MKIIDSFALTDVHQEKHTTKDTTYSMTVRQPTDPKRDQSSVYTYTVVYCCSFIYRKPRKKGNMKFVTACLAASIRLAGAFAPSTIWNARGVVTSSLRMAEDSDEGIVLNKWSR